MLVLSLKDSREGVTTIWDWEEGPENWSTRNIQWRESRPGAVEEVQGIWIKSEVSQTTDRMWKQPWKFPSNNFFKKEKDLISYIYIRVRLIILYMKNKANPNFGRTFQPYKVLVNLNL